MDGVFFRDAEGDLRFFQVAAPTDEDLKAKAQRIRRRVLKILGVRKLSRDGEGDDWSDPLAEEHPAYAATCAASVGQLTAIGPRAGRKTLRMGVEPEDEPAPLNLGRHANVHGFDIHAGAAVPPNDRQRVERLPRYQLRPPIAQGRLSLLSDGKVALELKNQWSDGTTHLLFEPIELIEKIAVLIPRPQSNLIIYNGVLAPNAKWRKEVVKYGRPVVAVPESKEEPEPEKPKDAPGVFSARPRCRSAQVRPAASGAGRDGVYAGVTGRKGRKVVLEATGERRYDLFQVETKRRKRNGGIA
ncbi:MAG: transposase [Deltaproteobacteria bacterium]|nr:transposase [Deltaproteobacteria bacterium]